MVDISIKKENGIKKKWTKNYNIFLIAINFLIKHLRTENFVFFVFILPNFIFIFLGFARNFEKNPSNVL